MLTDRSDVDSARIGLVGVCLGGGYAVRAAATDARVRAVAGIAGVHNSPAHFAEAMGIDTYRSALRGFLDSYDEYLPAVAAHSGEAAMPGNEPYAYYGTQRAASPHWRNEVTRGSLHKADDYCSPDLARRLHERTPDTKEIHWLDTRTHIDLYDTEPHVSQAARLTAEFLHRHL